MRRERGTERDIQRRLNERELYEQIGETQSNRKEKSETMREKERNR